jgi:hypothetical protein
MENSVHGFNMDKSRNYVATEFQCQQPGVRPYVTFEYQMVLGTPVIEGIGEAGDPEHGSRHFATEPDATTRGSLTAVYNAGPCTRARKRKRDELRPCAVSKDGSEGLWQISQKERDDLKLMKLQNVDVEVCPRYV